MLVQKLRVDDLQSERGYFDGVMVYSQNKVGEENVIQVIDQQRWNVVKYIYSSTVFNDHFEVLPLYLSHFHVMLIYTSTPLH